MENNIHIILFLSLSLLFIKFSNILLKLVYWNKLKSNQPHVWVCIHVLFTFEFCQIDSHFATKQIIYIVDLYNDYVENLFLCRFYFEIYFSPILWGSQIILEKDALRIKFTLDYTLSRQQSFSLSFGIHICYFCNDPFTWKKTF